MLLIGAKVSVCGVYKIAGSPVVETRGCGERSDKARRTILGLSTNVIFKVTPFVLHNAGEHEKTEEHHN